MVRSVPQLVRALGLPYDGTVKDARQRYRNQLVRTLGYLELMGWVEARETLYEANGEGRGILVRLKAGVAQSVRAGQYGGGGRDGGRRGAHSGSEGPFRGGYGADRFFLAPVVIPLSGEAVNPSSEEIKSLRNGGASACVTGDLESPYGRFLAHAAERRRTVAATVALGVLMAGQGTQEGGSALAELPCAAQAPVTPLARAMFRTALPGVSPAISAQRGEQLEAAARRLDHYSGCPGIWVEVAARVLAGWQDGIPGPFLTDPPRSLGALAIELRRLANTWRYGAQRRRRQRLRPLAASTERQKVKNWRAELREAERERPGSGRQLRRPRDR